MKEYELEFAEFLYYTPTKIDNRSLFFPVRAGHSLTKPNYKIGPRRIECFSIHIVREGSIGIEFNGEQIILKAGDMFCLYPNKTYTYYKIADDRDLQLCWLAIDGPGIEQILDLIGFTMAVPYILNRWNPQLQDILQEIFKIMRNPTKITSYFEIQSLLYRLFSILIHANREPNMNEQSRWIKQCREYIELHATEGITVQQVSQFAGLNRTYFSTVFRKSVGISPVQYIFKVKMSKAKELLLGTSASITEIAYSVGYPNLFSFTRAFKKYFSLSPTEYRNKARSSECSSVDN